jgi:hypothetical protein
MKSEEFDIRANGSDEEILRVVLCKVKPLSATVKLRIAGLEVDGVVRLQTNIDALLEVSLGSVKSPSTTALDRFRVKLSVEGGSPVSFHVKERFGDWLSKVAKGKLAGESLRSVESRMSWSLGGITSQKIRLRSSWKQAWSSAVAGRRREESETKFWQFWTLRSR